MFAFIARDMATHKHRCHVFQCQISGKKIARVLKSFSEQLIQERRRKQDNIEKPRTEEEPPPPLPVKPKNTSTSSLSGSAAAEADGGRPAGRSVKTLKGSELDGETCLDLTFFFFFFWKTRSGQK